MRRFIFAIRFLTRLPVPNSFVPEAWDIGRSSIFFPLVGALIGLIQVGTLQLFTYSAAGSTLKSVLAAALLVVISVFITGALHLDGVADMADGFGGGHTKERTLEIMRDSLIGSYGAISLILVLILKIGAIAALIEGESAWQVLIVAPMLARWTILPLGKFLPYARKSGGLGQTVTDFVGWNELLGATLLAAVLLFSLLDWEIAMILWLAAAAVTLYIGRFCLRKIGGVTGDTLGANVEICEAIVLFTAVFLR